MSTPETTHPEVEFSTIDEALEDIAAGRMIVVVDDEDRENEGDLVMAAEHVTPDAINFMAMHARGWICLALTPERCDELDLELMTAKNDTPYETPFTVTIEAREGVTTGISAASHRVWRNLRVSRAASRLASEPKTTSCQGWPVIRLAPRQPMNSPGTKAGESTGSRVRASEMRNWICAKLMGANSSVSAT